VNTGIVILAVWEPILPTDWSKPGSSALRRLADYRVHQFWDADHAVAIAMKKAEASGKLLPNCCERDGFLWDLSAVYPPGAQWGDTAPEPVFMDGPVVRVASRLESAISK
jgi:hypothetical protein